MFYLSGLINSLSFIIKKYKGKNLVLNTNKTNFANFGKLPTVNNLNQRYLEILGEINHLKIQNSNINEDKIIISNKENLKKKLNLMREGQLENLQIVLDFDQTVTSFYTEKDISCNASFALFRKSKFPSKDFKTKLNDLFAFYAPIESNSEINLEEKRKILENWQFETSQAFIKEGLTKKMCIDIIENGDISLRLNFDKFFQICYQINLPFYIVSGGCSNVINTILNKIIPLNDYPSYFLYSNEMDFNDENKLTDLRMKVFSSNKENILNEKNLKFKKNTILFGDSTSDYYITKYVNHENFINVGFFNSKAKNQENLKSYLDKFDFVLANDSSFLLPEIILRHIINLDLTIEMKNYIEENNLRNIF